MDERATVAVPERVAVIDDLRRHEGFMSQGLTKMVISCQGSFEDVEGALAAGWADAAALQGRTLVLNCLAILGMRAGGGLVQTTDDVGFDRVGFAPPEAQHRARLLIDEGWAVARGTADATAWLSGLRSFLEETEAAFELGERLPVLRSPEGLFAAIRVLQGEQSVIEVLGLPSVIPQEWAEGLTQ